MFPIIVLDDAANDRLLTERVLRNCKILNPILTFQTGEQLLEYFAGDFEGLKAWSNRRRARLTASMTIAAGRGEPSHFNFSLTVVNTGGQTLHIVRHGIKGPVTLNAEQTERKTEIKAMHGRLLGWRGWFHREDMFRNGVFVSQELVVLAPGQPLAERDQWIDDWIGAELNNEAVAFAEDSLGRVYTCRFKVPAFSDVIRSRRPGEHEKVQERVPEPFRVDQTGKRINQKTATESRGACELPPAATS